MSSRFGLTFALGAVLVAGCTGGGEDPDVIPPSSATDNDTMTGMTASPTDSASGTGGATGSGTTGTGSGSTTGPDSCFGLSCSGHGTCVEGNEGPHCECDPGYVPTEDLTGCQVDETCINIRSLEEKCRQHQVGEPAVALFFGVDFCSGDAVTPEKLEELELGFKVLENGTDLSMQVESNATVIPRDVESYVALVLDASDSLTQSADYGSLITELRALVSSLKPGAGDASVHVSITVFGRRVQEYVDWTTDLDAVDSALAALAADPAAALVDPYWGAWNGMGTTLYDATKFGIQSTTAVRLNRRSVSLGGALATGTVVVVTDGIDTSGATLDTGLIQTTLNQVISIGISDQVSDQDLQDIGRDGSFLAPTPVDWTTAFDEISARVDNYPERSYLLGYCSSLNQGFADVQITLNGAVVPQTNAACSFNASYFDPNPPTCTSDFFSTECDASACGGLTACGACGDDQCCTNGQCVAPSKPAGTCSTNQQCLIAGQVCFMDACVDPIPIGGMCSTTTPDCMPGVAYCSQAGMCEAVKAVGQPCEKFEECATLHCQRENPDNMALPLLCLPEAKVGDECAGGKAECPAGLYCNGVCTPTEIEGCACSFDEQCSSGDCHDTLNVCVSTNSCREVWQDFCPA